jgi:hypothetical protein
MRPTYGVVWHEGSLPPATGLLELRSREIKLEGLADARPTEREIAYESLVGVHIGRAPEERIGGRPTLVLERRSGLPIRVTTVVQSSLVAELAERLAAFGRGRRAAVRGVVPLREGCAGRGTSRFRMPTSIARRKQL